MKKSLIVLSLSLLVFFSGFNMVRAQDQPKPKKDTVNIDTDAKPTFYYAAEDEKTSSGPGSKKGTSSAILIIGAVILVAGAAGFFLLKKKK